jgi:hypothetical protein
MPEAAETDIRHPEARVVPIHAEPHAEIRTAVPAAPPPQPEPRVEQPMEVRPMAAPPSRVAQGPVVIYRVSPYPYRAPMMGRPFGYGGGFGGFHGGFGGGFHGGRR